jgi:integrase
MKSFSLFKRGPDGKAVCPAKFNLQPSTVWRDRHWHFKFTFRRRVYTRCLQTNDAAIAQARARALHKEITEAVIAGQFERLDGTKIRHAVCATLGELLSAYRQSPVDASRKTREANCQALLHLLKKIEAGDNVLKTPYHEILNARTPAQFFGLAAAADSGDDDDDSSGKRTANSNWAKAASLCAPRALAYYKSTHIYHSCLDDFLQAGLLHRFTRLPRIEYNPPEDATIQNTLAAWEALDDRNLFLALGHELAFGLRIGEVAQARWNWWTVRQGYPVLDGEAHVKNKTGLVQVRALDPYYTTLRLKALARGWLPSPGGEEQGEAGSPLIITGSNAFRTDGIFRAASDFLRRQGWQTRKTNHALRAYAGSQIAMKYGIYDAQTWLRHSSVKVTEGHYSHFIRKFKPANLDDLTARWAVLDQTPILRIVEQTV